MGELDVVNFTNVDNEDFVGQYGGQDEQPIRPGDTKQLVSFKAQHFAKQLATKILMREDKDWSNESPLLAKKIGEILGEVSVPAVVASTEPEKPVEPEFTEAPKEESTPAEKTEPSATTGVKCDVCGKVVKNEFALRMHRGRFHK